MELQPWVIKAGGAMTLATSDNVSKMYCHVLCDTGYLYIVMVGAFFVFSFESDSHSVASQKQCLLPFGL